MLEVRKVPWVTDMQRQINQDADRREPSNHYIINKLTAIRVLLRRADTLCMSPGVIDAIRAADLIVTELGDKLGVALANDLGGD
jgi:hypothetical protein